MCKLFEQCIFTTKQDNYFSNDSTNTRSKAPCTVNGCTASMQFIVGKITRLLFHLAKNCRLEWRVKLSPPTCRSCVRDRHNRDAREGITTHQNTNKLLGEKPNPFARRHSCVQIYIYTHIQTGNHKIIFLNIHDDIKLLFYKKNN